MTADGLPEGATLTAMPELPEVETVRRGLLTLVAPGTLLLEVRILHRALRQPIPPGTEQVLAGRRLLTIERRAKFLIWRFEGASLINHLGMTGNWRALGHPQRHDHGLLLFEGVVLAFNDPRRFGLFLPAGPDPETGSPLLTRLGPEPLGSEFHVAYLAEVCRRRQTPIKVLLLDQQVVAGIGNIYAAEACFAARIAPQRPAGTLTRPELGRLVRALRRLLRRAIAAGGSTVEDFQATDGSPGTFQLALSVYGKDGQPCRSCGHKLHHATLAGRSTVWCPVCQR